MTPHQRRLLTAVSVTLLLGSLAACSSAQAPDDDPTDEAVTIIVGGMPSADNEAQLKTWQRKVDAFTAANPNITVEGREVSWDAETFAAQLAAGTVPTTLRVPLTEPQGLISRGQIADITSELAEVGITEDLEQTILGTVQDADDAIYGVPVEAYSVGLVYNRALFEEAGLDPDSPPQTWDEVLTAAKAISDNTDAAGFAQMSSGNAGGWILTAETYGFGGSVVDDSGSSTVYADDAAGEGLRGALEFLDAVRWEEDAASANSLLSMGDLYTEFAAGKIGMYVGPADSYAYRNIVITNGLPAEDFGASGLPQSAGSTATMLGGTAVIVSATATDAQRLAAVKWIAFAELGVYLDEELAVADAQAKAEDGQAVGKPSLAPVNQEQYDQYLEWIADEINVPQENFASYMESAQELDLVLEPPVKAQEIYANLDAVVQAVLSTEGSDIPALLEQSAAAVDATLSR